MGTENACFRLEELGFHFHIHPEAGWVVITGHASNPDPEWRALDLLGRRAMRELGHFGYETLRVGTAEFRVLNGHALSGPQV